MKKTELSLLMTSEDVDEDLKREAIGILAEEGLSNLPPSNFREGEADQLARAWNSKEGVATVTAEEQLWFYIYTYSKRAKLNVSILNTFCR